MNGYSELINDLLNRARINLFSLLLLIFLTFSYSTNIGQYNENLSKPLNSVKKAFPKVESDINELFEAIIIATNDFDGLRDSYLYQTWDVRITKSCKSMFEREDLWWVRLAIDSCSSEISGLLKYYLDELNLSDDYVELAKNIHSELDTINLSINEINKYGEKYTGKYFKNLTELEDFLNSEDVRPPQVSVIGVSFKSPYSLSILLFAILILQLSLLSYLVQINKEVKSGCYIMRGFILLHQNYMSISLKFLVLAISPIVILLMMNNDKNVQRIFSHYDNIIYIFKISREDPIAFFSFLIAFMLSIAFSIDTLKILNKIKKKIYSPQKTVPLRFFYRNKNNKQNRN